MIKQGISSEMSLALIGTFDIYPNLLSIGVLVFIIVVSVYT